MARKSRRNLLQNQKEKIKPYSVAGYVRLSNYDNGYKNGMSIETQISYIKKFIYEQSDLCLYKIYSDNGFTGTNFERDAWSNLIEDIKAGIINCIVVKDFSRLGRNYIEVGSYLEKIFPFLGVRVISINDSFDSQINSFDGKMLMSSLTNIVNEYYARDVSTKITKTFKTKQAMGLLCGSVFPYGYKRSTILPKLEVDKEAADIVKKIFQWRTLGKGCPTIANYLNDLAIPSPGLYRYMNGDNRFKRCISSKWSSKHVSEILVNPSYLGYLVQGKTRTSFFETNGKTKFLPKEEWFIIENSHEPLVSKEIFELTQKMAEKSRRQHQYAMEKNASIPKTENPFTGKIFCGQCGKAMTRRSRVIEKKRDYCFFCNSKNSKIGCNCIDTHIHEDVLIETIKKVIEQHILLLSDFNQKWYDIKNSKQYPLKQNQIKTQHQNEMEHLHLLESRKNELYTNVKIGLVTREEYSYLKEQYNKEIASSQQKIETYNSIKELYDLKEYSNIIKEVPTNISLDIIKILVKKLIIYPKKRIEIYFNFMDKIEQWNEILQNIKFSINKECEV